MCIADAMNKEENMYKAPTHAEIAMCAYFIWENEGRPEGRCDEFWREAELLLYTSRIHDQSRHSK